MKGYTPTNKELIEAVLETRGIRKLSGEIDGLDPLLPHLLLDIEYHIFNHSIRNADVFGMTSKHRGEWNRSYGIFTRGQFTSFREGTPLYMRIIDLMDDLEEYLKEPIQKLRDSLWDFFPEFDDVDRGLLVESLICNTLIRIAQSYWSTVYRTRACKPEINLQIQSMAIHSAKFIGCLLEDTKVQCGVKRLDTREDIVKATSDIENAVDTWIYQHRDSASSK